MLDRPLGEGFTLLQALTSPLWVKVFLGLSLAAALSWAPATTPVWPIRLIQIQ